MWHTLDSDVEPHRRVERTHLAHDEVLQFGVEHLPFFLIDEVATLAAPHGDGVRHPIGYLLEGPLALGKTQRAPEVLLGEDVGGIDAPCGGHLHAELFECHLTSSPVGDAGVATLPDHRVVRMHSCGGEMTADADA